MNAERRPRIGVLALQGAVREHVNAIREIGAEPVEVRLPRDVLAGALGEVVADVELEHEVEIIAGAGGGAEDHRQRARLLGREHEPVPLITGSRVERIFVRPSGLERPRLRGTLVGIGGAGEGRKRDPRRADLELRRS